MKYLKKKVILYLLAFLLCGLFAFLIYNLVYDNDKNKIDDESKITSLSDDVIDDNRMLDSRVLGIEIDGNLYTIFLEDNRAALELFNLTPMEIVMDDLNNNEKYYDLGVSLTGESTYSGEIKKGDLMIYKNNTIVIFYKDLNTEYKYIKIGHIDNMPDLNNDRLEVKFVR